MARDTKIALLDLAQRLAQTRGLNGFSFKDLARGLGIRAASVHHHFPTKADLGREVMARYRVRFQAELAAIHQAHHSPRRQLERFMNLFRKTLGDGNRLCLCGMLATEYTTLPEAVQHEVRTFYAETEAWLAQVLGAGRSEGALAFEGAPRIAARTLLATLEGAMIAARTFDDPERLERTGKWLLAALVGTASRRRPR